LTIIYLGCQLPGTSSDLTRERSGPLHSSSIRSCTRWGLPSQAVTCLLVSSCLTVPPLPGESSWRFVSVALSLGSPLLDVIQHPALRSSDFPQAKCPRSSDLLALPLYKNCRLNSRGAARTGEEINQVFSEKN